MIKRIIDKIGRSSPDYVSRYFAKIPFKMRHDKAYSEFQHIINKSKKWSEGEFEDYIVTHFDAIFQFAKKFKLYKEKYEKCGVLNLEIKSIDDIKKVPILTKDEVRGSITEFTGRYLEDTGGTTGNPLQLYLNKEVWAKEWAFYHDAWGKVGYEPTCAKFQFRYERLENKFLEYDFRHNSYLVNTYKMKDNYIEEFFNVLIEYKIKYFHGYPSVINDFLREIEDEISKEQKNRIKQQIKCCFYGSEMPLPNSIKYLKEVWGLDFISCYGHTETCILATTKQNTLKYFPYHIYGYAEEEDGKLIGTSYHNFDMPLIRFDTDDRVKAEKFKNGMLKSFDIEEGRIFDAILDKKNLKMYPVGLYLKLGIENFNGINYIQFFQEKKGFLTVIITKNKEEGFDKSNLKYIENLTVDFIYLEEPIRTAAGKVPLRVKELPKTISF